MGSLDYDAHVPMDSNTPFQITGAAVGVKAARERIQNPDFVPSDYRKRRDAVRDRLPERPHDLSWIDSHIFTEPVEYRSGKDQAKIREARKAKVDTVYQGILDTHRPAMRQFNRARRMVAESSKKDLSSPNDKLRSAIRLVAKGPPITKKQAFIEARERVIRIT